MPARFAADRRRPATDGFVLIEVLLALAVLALLAGLILPRVSPEPGPTALHAMAHEIAGHLRQDRNSAIRERREVVTRFDPHGRVLHSSSGRRTLEIPQAVDVDFVPGPAESPPGGDDGVRFHPGGGSSGGLFALRRGNIGYEVRINWLTGRIEVDEQGAR